MKIIKEPKGVVFTVLSQGLNEVEKSQISAIIQKEKIERKKKEFTFA